MTVYLIHGQEPTSTARYLTLAEAMRDRKVVVEETRSVNCLAIRNTSDDDIYIQAGDIVKGGQQDRTIADDFILPANSPDVPIASFCVEHGRWTAREGERGDRFGGSPNALVSKELKLAARLRADQGGVWNGVSQAQQDLSRTLHADPSSDRSPSSLQLTIENPAVQAWVQEYVQTLGPLPDTREDVVGYVCILNGQLNSADLYATHALFRKVWPKLLTASAVEAIAMMQQPSATRQATPEDATALLSFAQVDRSGAKQIHDRTTALAYDNDSAILFETRDTARGGMCVHRCYLAK